MQGGASHHHQRIRKLAGEPVNPSVIVWDKIVWIVAFLGPLFTIPQLVNVWIFRETAGVSAVSWGAYTLFSLVWLMYSSIHKDRALFVNSVLWLMANGLVALGALLF